MNINNDIYFEKAYGTLYEASGYGLAVDYMFENELGRIRHQFIKREIPISLSDGPWFDIMTPYGYGGPVIVDLVDANQERALVGAFIESFAAYCKEEKIVSEFIRFHPLVNNGPTFRDVYQARPIRHTIGTDLGADDPVLAEFSRGARKNIRQCLNHGITYRVFKAPENLDSFKEIYYATMMRNNAEAHYYFGDAYFNGCLSMLRDHLLYVETLHEGKVIAAALCFIYGDRIHFHLSGTLNDYMHLSPEYLLHYAVVRWGKDNGYRMVHNGGGRSNAEDDSLYKFKSQFGKVKFDFYVGHRVWNSTVYRRLLEVSDRSDTAEFFPAYRATR